MAKKYSGESSGDDDVRDEKDRFRHRSLDRDTRLGSRYRHGDESDSSDSKDVVRHKHSEKRGERTDNDRTTERDKKEGDRDRGRWGQSETHDKKEFQRSRVEDGELLGGSGRLDKDRLHQHGNGRTRKDRMVGDNQRESNQSTDEDDKLVRRDRKEKERTHSQENGNRRRGMEEDDIGRKRRLQHDSDDDDDRKDYRESRRDKTTEDKHRRNRNSDDDDDRKDYRESRRMDRSTEYKQRRNHDSDDDDDRNDYRESRRDKTTEDKKRRNRYSDDDDRKDYRGSRRDRTTEDNQRRHSREDDSYKAEKNRTNDVAESENFRSFRKKEEGDGKLLEGSSLHKGSSVQEGSNADASNLGKSGGVYIPPFKLARMMKEVQDKSSTEYQRLTWDALRKSINGLVNKVNATNIKNIIPELFAENLIRGRGLFCRSCMKSQMASPVFTDVFSALVAVVNTKFPEVGELLLRRIVLQLKRAYKRNDKPQLLAAVKFIAHLVNQQVAHEIIALELLTVLLENPTDDSVEVAVGFVTECGSILQDLSPKGLHGIFERFRGILHEGEIDKRVQFLIEGLFAIRKAKFQGYPAVRPELDLVEQEDQLTHEISLQEEIDPEITLDIFKLDPNFLDNEMRYEDLKKTILGEESGEEEGSEAESDDADDDESDDEDDEEQMEIRDETETNLVNLRRTIYLTIMSSVDFEEAGHKLLKIKLEPGQEMELCIMLLECCSQERTYLRYYGLLGQRFCAINKVHQENFEKCFVQQYSMIHRLETNKLRNVAKFFAHLLGTDALPWHVLAYIRLTEEDTTSSSRIFIKILFQELSEHLGIWQLNQRLNDPTMQDSFESIFPKDNPKNTRFSINFFTSIGLGGITENLREYLKNMPRLIMQQQKPASDSGSGSGSGSGSEDESNSGSSESEPEPEPDSSSSEESKRRDSRQRKRSRRD